MTDRASDPPNGLSFLRLSGELDDVVSAVHAWDLDFRQLEPGAMAVEIVQAGTADVLLARVRFSHRLELRGTSPRGTRTFSVVGRGLLGRFLGQPVDDASLLLYPRSRELEAVSSPQFRSDTISISEARLAAVAQDLGLRQEGEARRSVIRCSPDILAAIRSRCRAIHEALHERPQIRELPALRREMESELPTLLLQALNGVPVRQPRPSSRSRYLALSRAREFIESHLDDPPTVQTVCGAARVSWRTLDYAFREHYALSPREYLKAIRLHAARRALQRSGPDEKIADMANRYGFWHMGQFAADYRTQFGELPSGTRARPRAGVRGPGVLAGVGAPQRPAERRP
ncbi:MAG: helix-turn-helix domain-containing protein [Acidobacteriota bacterium]|jgi:AraC family ethanolamine operon transcriptional activator